jgi:hypothetical protein
MARKEKTEDAAVESAPKPKGEKPAKSEKPAKGEKPGKEAPPAAAPPAPAAKPAKVKIPKLAPKNKSRLPRKQKKAQQKLAAAKQK